MQRDEANQEGQTSLPCHMVADTHRNILVVSMPPYHAQFYVGACHELSSKIFGLVHGNEKVHVMASHYIAFAKMPDI